MRDRLRTRTANYHAIFDQSLVTIGLDNIKVVRRVIVSGRCNRRADRNCLFTRVGVDGAPFSGLTIRADELWQARSPKPLVGDCGNSVSSMRIAARTRNAQPTAPKTRLTIQNVRLLCERGDRSDGNCDLEHGHAACEHFVFVKI